MLHGGHNTTRLFTGVKKIITLSLLIIILSLPNITFTSALSYSSEEHVKFTLNPNITIDISGNLNIFDLAPGSSSDSNIITVTASSNAIAGYSLSSTVGNSTHTNPSYNNTNLNHSNGSNTFTNLDTNRPTLNDFNPNINSWGYSYSPCTNTDCANTPNWISGDITSTTNPGYNGLPLYTTSNPIKLINESTAGTKSVKFKIGANAASTQVAGTYTNVINFIGVANPTPLADPGLSVEAEDIVSGNDVVINVSANPYATGDVTIQLNDSDYDHGSYAVPLSNGSAELRIPDFSTGNYTVNVSYPGNSIFSSASASTTFSVENPNPDIPVLLDPELSVTAKDVPVGEDIMVNVSIDPLATGDIDVNFADGNHYSATLVRGKAKIIIEEPPEGRYSITASYPGDASFLPAQETIHVTVY